VLALGRGTGTDGPGWRVRVVPNLYPAFARQEVVVHAPTHVRSFGELDDAQVDAVAEAWLLRGLAGAEAGLGYLHALVNEGRDAGASLAHSHSQLVWLGDEPPAVAAESGDPELLAARDDLVVAERDGALALVHEAGRTPYESVILQRDAPLQAVLLLLRDIVRRLRVVEGAVPWNAWLHPGHLELVPRLSIFAGVELGAGIWVNAVAPEVAARALREAAV
jgi:UDPglucose--hexose-1-phosphate uridylyltransferase